MGVQAAVGSKQAKKLAREALQRKEIAFAKKYAEASNEDLIGYVLQCAEKLGFSPWDTDVIGVELLKKRFGSWSLVLAKAGLKFTPGSEREDVPDLFMREVQLQDMLHQRTLAAMQRQEREFSGLHEDDSDEELLEYIRSFAKRLRHTPNQCEIIGGNYVSRRFGGWSKAVKQAGLPQPPDNPPKPFHRQNYLDELKRQRESFEKNWPLGSDD